jgi:hypothetical protein
LAGPLIGHGSGGPIAHARARVAAASALREDFLAHVPRWSRDFLPLGLSIVTARENR